MVQPVFVIICFRYKFWTVVYKISEMLKKEFFPKNRNLGSL